MEHGRKQGFFDFDVDLEGLKVNML